MSCLQFRSVVIRKRLAWRRSLQSYKWYVIEMNSLIFVLVFKMFNWHVTLDYGTCMWNPQENTSIFCLKVLARSSFFVDLLYLNLFIWVGRKSLNLRALISCGIVCFLLRIFSSGDLSNCYFFILASHDQGGFHSSILNTFIHQEDTFRAENPKTGDEGETKVEDKIETSKKKSICAITPSLSRRRQWRQLGHVCEMAVALTSLVLVYEEVKEITRFCLYLKWLWESWNNGTVWWRLIVISRGSRPS